MNDPDVRQASRFHSSTLANSRYRNIKSTNDLMGIRQDKSGVENTRCRKRAAELLSAHNMERTHICLSTGRCDSGRCSRPKPRHDVRHGTVPASEVTGRYTHRVVPESHRTAPEAVPSLFRGPCYGVIVSCNPKLRVAGSWPISTPGSW